MLYITAKIFSGSGILKRAHSFQREAKQDAMLGIRLLKGAGTPVAQLMPRTGLVGFHMHSSASVKVARVKPRGPLRFPESGDMRLTILLIRAHGAKTVGPSEYLLKLWVPV